MIRITAIAPTKRDLLRAQVRVGGKVVATLPTKVIAQLGLDADQPWDEQLQAEVAAAVAYDKAFRAAMRLANRRMLSRRRLSEKLTNSGYQETVRLRVLDLLTELGVINDEEFGRTLIEQTRLRKAAGPALLRTKLLQQGLDRQLVDRLVDEATDNCDQVAQAAALARKRLSSLRQLDAIKCKRRLWGMLARRGFNSETIEAALKQLPQMQEDGVDEFE